ncbi:MAG: hypothetical protein IT291_11395 [Deltaproteobacteria bacterium]|nr:hypothetical protein [Deltaproteobacteria bacterium]
MRIAIQQESKLKNYAKLILAFSAIALCSCSRTQEPIIRYQYYTPAFRPHGPEAVYSRLTWSHLPQPIPRRAGSITAYVSPVYSLELPHSNFAEAIQAIAQTIGYECSYPQHVEGRAISIKTTGTIDELLLEIGKQAGVSVELNHEERIIRIVDDSALSGVAGSFFGGVLQGGLS